ncbi:branched-chain amino acid ABC transporter permease [Actinophytocola oryzae]|uniref:Amino acid/amide ABC transporter membrane protein 2 (HAAT family) n=1 Tax=Actinophytocola oryzae TaxID=502181 RepID=A0A4R7V174_9PSEU|nr:branched-chain amino acid ABC transporter permease [Actinophytocola oryzae]TDV42580.1 amino acid/amide ABC transporter membrane protein 2 (HAAT family) [Actinophytocola oryzae]
MSRLNGLLPAALARPFTAIGGVLFLIGAMLPWVTFLLNDGPYPEKATLQFFDAPFELTGFRWHVLLLGVAVVVLSFVPLRGRERALRALGFGGLAIGLITAIFVTGDGGGLGAITAVDGVYAFGSIVTLVGGILVILGASATGLGEIPHWPDSIFGLTGMAQRLVSWLVLIVAFGAVLWLVAQTLTAGGIGGAAFPYAGGIFLAFLGFAGGLLGALHGIGLTGWVSRLSENNRVFSIIVLLACAVLLPFPFTGAGSQYWMQVAATIGVYAATAIGLNIVVGLSGLLDLGYVAFMGIGAFVAANLSGAAASQLGIDLPFPVAALCAAVVAGIFGAIVGSPTLRVRGDYLAIVTLAFGEIFTRAAQNNIGDLTGGASAIPGIPQISMFGTAFNEPIEPFGIKLPPGVLYYFLIVGVVALIMAVFANLKNSRIGRAWIAIREDEDAARAMGIRTGKMKILAFLVGATLAGLAGSIFVHKLGTASYDSFKFLESVTLLAAVILGGMGTIPGAVLGASLLFVLPEKLREFQDYRLFFFGIALILIMRFRPQGIVPDRVRRAEFAGETADGRSIEEIEEQRVREQEEAEREHQAPAGPQEGRA